MNPPEGRNSIDSIAGTLLNLCCSAKIDTKEEQTEIQ